MQEATYDESLVAVESVQRYIVGNFEVPFWERVEALAISAFQTVVGILMIAVVVYALFTFGWFLARGLEWKRSPVDKLSERYMTYRLFEDGSWVGVTDDGVQEMGCISGGLCKFD